MSVSRDAGAFSDRVAVLFATQVFTAGVGLVNGLLLARLLGPAAKGDYTLLVLLPNTVMILAQLGLPQAFGFYAARGETRTMVTKALVLTGIVSVASLLASIVLFSLLQDSLLNGLAPALVLLAMLAVPLLLNANYTTGIVIGRQEVRWYAFSNILSAIASVILLVVLLAAAGLGVAGALVAFLVPAAMKAAVLLATAGRLTSAMSDARPVSYRDLFRYGLPLYPGSLTQFFSYRVDVYLLALLLAEPSAPIGYYSIAVGLTELVFFIPDAVATLFFPHVAGSSREESARQVPMVSRVTLLMTACAAALAVPAGTLTIVLLLPAYLPSLPALYILLPGVVAISVSKILSGYLSGLGRTGVTSALNIGAFVLNVVLNLLLIPALGIAGAAVASLVSYSASSLAFSIVAARLAGAPLSRFWVPGRSDVGFSMSAVVAVARRLAGRSAAQEGSA